MRKRHEIEEMCSRAYEAYDQSATSWNEAVAATLDWVWGNVEDEPIEDEDRPAEG